MSYDTGAAAIAFPKSFAPGVRGNCQLHRTATGEFTEDCGAPRLTADTESGDPRRITGRLASVHEVLVSGSEWANFGMNGWRSKGGGYLAPRDSKLAERIGRLVEQEARRKDHKMVPLCEERGVNNFYVKAGTSKGKVETVEGHDLKSLSREELEREVAAARASGFHRQC